MSPVYESLVRHIAEYVQPSKPFVVGINGTDGSGKSSLAQGLKEALVEAGKNVTIISIDDFHNPKSFRYLKGDTGEAFYYDSINYQAFHDKAIHPFKESTPFPKQVTIKGFDLDTDQKQESFETVFGGDIVLIEGIFLFKPEFQSVFDLKIYVDASFETTKARMLPRDLPTDALDTQKKAYLMKFENKYKAGQLLYLNDVVPKLVADVIIDNNDYLKPKWIKGF